MDAKRSLEKLIAWCEFNNYRGYDPYDLLNSKLNIQAIGHKISYFGTQIHKRNPLNIRKLLGINKEFIPKGMGLFLDGYCNLYRINKSQENIEKMNYFFGWLKNNYSQGFSGYSWGLNYDYASADGYFKKYSPSLVVSSFVFNAIFNYYQITKNDEARKVLLSIGDFILNDLPVTKFENSLCFSYTPFKKDLCYNANALGSQVMAKLYNITGDYKYLDIAVLGMNYIISKQHPDGYWNYSENNGIEKKQIDFHQGFILDSILDFIDFSKISDKKYLESYIKGVNFYKTNQFFENGQSLWRWPRVHPVEIHNQAQGIITFSKGNKINSTFSDFALKITEWTIKNMQSEKKGYFYFRKYPFFKNKIPYMRWNQAWMFLALSFILKETNKK